MKKILIILLIFLTIDLKAQDFTLAVNKLDDFTKEIVRIAPYQAIAAKVLLGSTHINVNVSRNGNKYFIGFQSQFYSSSKSLENNSIKKGSKIYFKLESDSIAQAVYNAENGQPIVTYENSLQLWRYNIEFDFSIEEYELEKLSKSPIELVRVENGQDRSDFEVREKFRGTSPRLYFINFIPLLQ